MRFINDPAYEKPTANPAMVQQIMIAITTAIEHACIDDVTTAADVLSALFTTLDHTLRVVRDSQAAEDEAYNSKEISRVLGEMLMEFGCATKH